MKSKTVQDGKMAINLRFKGIYYKVFERRSQLANLKPFVLSMRVLIVLACFLVPFSTQAQKITLSARVQDNVNSEPLPFASVGIKGKPIGTVTNLQGEFDFHL